MSEHQSMNHLFRRIYTLYALVLFVLTFLLLFPIFLIIAQRSAWHKASYHLNKFWAKVFFGMIFMPVEVETRGDTKRLKGQAMVFCPNHASYMDIPMVGYASSPFVFMGKSSLAKVPLFGYMYRKIHITVDRSSLKSRHSTYERTKAVVDRGMSLVIFPEGGIYTKNPPTMVPFKNGAFKLAIEKQIPLIPVTIPYNWIILPDNGRYVLQPHRAKVIFHEPIETKGLGMDSLPALKQEVFDIITKELSLHRQES